MDAAAEESPSNLATHSAVGQDMPPLSKVRPNSGPNPSPPTQPSLQSSEKGRKETMVRMLIVVAREKGPMWQVSWEAVPCLSRQA